MQALNQDRIEHEEQGKQDNMEGRLANTAFSLGNGPHLVPADQLVGIGQTRHEAAFLQPIDGGERAGEEDALHCGERNKTLP